MRTIVKRNNVSVQAVGYQTELPGVEYVEHEYITRVGDTVYNALTGEIAVVDEDDHAEMVRRWFLAPAGMNLAGLAHLTRQTAHNMKRSRWINRYVIFTTTGCNGNCEYCFQKDIEPLTMSEETAADVANWILKHANPGLLINLRWFGGEPLVNKAVISQICGVLRQNRRRYQSSMSSNGDLFKDVTEEEIELWQLKSVQFTLDDCGAAYDRIKGLTEGAYDRLKATIERFPNASFTLRVHYDPAKGTEPCYQIIDDFKDYSNVVMYAAMLYDGTKTEDDYKTLLRIEDAMIAAGKFNLKLPNMTPDINCMADSPTQACITPTGDLTPCEHFVTGESYGSIYSDERNQTVLNEWAAKCKDEDTCEDCPLYPSCEMLCRCETAGKCSEGYKYYQLEKIKRALSEVI